MPEKFPRCWGKASKSLLFLTVLSELSPSDSPQNNAYHVPAKSSLSFKLFTQDSDSLQVACKESDKDPNEGITTLNTRGLF